MSIIVGKKRRSRRVARQQSNKRLKANNSLPIVPDVHDDAYESETVPLSRASSPSASAHSNDEQFDVELEDEENSDKEKDNESPTESPPNSNTEPSPQQHHALSDTELAAFAKYKKRQKISVSPYRLVIHHKAGRTTQDSKLKTWVHFEAFDDKIKVKENLRAILDASNLPTDLDLYTFTYLNHPPRAGRASKGKPIPDLVIDYDLDTRHVWWDSDILTFYLCQVRSPPKEDKHAAPSKHKSSSKDAAAESKATEYKNKIQSAAEELNTVWGDDKPANPYKKLYRRVKANDHVWMKAVIKKAQTDWPIDTIAEYADGLLKQFDDKKAAQKQQDQTTENCQPSELQQVLVELKTMNARIDKLENMYNSGSNSNINSNIMMMLQQQQQYMLMQQQLQWGKLPTLTHNDKDAESKQKQSD